MQAFLRVLEQDVVPHVVLQASPVGAKRALIGLFLGVGPEVTSHALAPVASVDELATQGARQGELGLTVLGRSLMAKELLLVVD